MKSKIESIKHLDYSNEQRNVAFREISQWYKGKVADISNRETAHLRSFYSSAISISDKLQQSLHSRSDSSGNLLNNIKPDNKYDKRDYRATTNRIISISSSILLNEKLLTNISREGQFCLKRKDDIYLSANSTNYINNKNSTSSNKYSSKSSSNINKNSDNDNKSYMNRLTREQLEQLRRRIAEEETESR